MDITISEWLVTENMGFYGIGSTGINGEEEAPDLSIARKSPYVSCDPGFGHPRRLLGAMYPRL